MALAAQVSLYPLRQERLSPSIDAALETFRKHGLDVQPGTMSTVLLGDGDALFDGLKEAFREAAQIGPIVMNVTLSNTCPVPE